MTTNVQTPTKNLIESVEAYTVYTEKFERISEISRKNAQTILDNKVYMVAVENLIVGEVVTRITNVEDTYLMSEEDGIEFRTELFRMNNLNSEIKNDYDTYFANRSDIKEDDRFNYSVGLTAKKNISTALFELLEDAQYITKLDINRSNYAQYSLSKINKLTETIVKFVEAYKVEISK